MMVTITGGNSYAIGQEIDRVKTGFLKEYGELAIEKLDGEESSSERLIEAMQSLPFLASKKLVILKNPGAQKRFAEQVDQLIKTAPETNEVLLIEPKIDKRSSYYKVLKSKTDYREFNEMDTANLNNWIVQYVKKQPGQISSSDASYLIDRVGHNQQLIANELDKLISYNSQISKETIDLLTEKTPQSTIFELLDAAFAGNNNQTFKLYKEQRELKVEPQQLMAMLTWQLQALAIVKTAGERSFELIAKEAKLNPFVVRKTMLLAQKITLRDIKKLINKALKLDIKLKSQSIDADDALQYFLLTITS